MSAWDKKANPVPDKTDNHRMKEFFKAKYTDKRFAESISESDSDSSDDKKKKKKKKSKKRDKKKRKDSSDESEEEVKHRCCYYLFPLLILFIGR